MAGWWGEDTHFTFYDQLSAEEQQSLVRQLEGIDVDRVNRVWARAIKAEEEVVGLFHDGGSLVVVRYKRRHRFLGKRLNPIVSTLWVLPRPLCLLPLFLFLRRETGRRMEADGDTGDYGQSGRRTAHGRRPGYTIGIVGAQGVLSAAAAAGFLPCCVANCASRRIRSA
jgi:hypothetical protein